MVGDGLGSGRKKSPKAPPHGHKGVPTNTENSGTARGGTPVTCQRHKPPAQPLPEGLVTGRGNSYNLLGRRMGRRGEARRGRTTHCGMFRGGKGGAQVVWGGTRVGKQSSEGMKGARSM